MPDWLREALPSWALPVVDWLLQPLVLGLLAGGSALLFVLGLVGVPVVLARLPADFFSRSERRRRHLQRQHRPYWYGFLHVLKNIIGAVLLFLGLVMLFVPGQGLLTILVGLFLADFPGKRHLQRWVICHRSVRRRIDALRHRAGRAPLELPE